MAEKSPLFDDALPPDPLQALLGAMAAQNTLCRVRRCRRQGRCLAVDPATGEPVCLPRLAAPAAAGRLDAIWAADGWLLQNLLTGIPQPFGEWPAETIGPRLAVCRKLQTELDPGPDLSRFRRWWQGCRTAAIAAGWSMPRRSSASPRWRPLEPPKPPSRPTDPAGLQSPEMAQPAAETAENSTQTLDL